MWPVESAFDTGCRRLGAQGSNVGDGDVDKTTGGLRLVRVGRSEMELYLPAIDEPADGCLAEADPSATAGV